MLHRFYTFVVALKLIWQAKDNKPGCRQKGRNAENGVFQAIKNPGIYPGFLSQNNLVIVASRYSERFF